MEDDDEEFGMFDHYGYGEDPRTDEPYETIADKEARWEDDDIADELNTPPKELPDNLDFELEEYSEGEDDPEGFVDDDDDEGEEDMPEEFNIYDYEYTVDLNEAFLEKDNRDLYDAIDAESADLAEAREEELLVLSSKSKSRPRYSGRYIKDSGIDPIDVIGPLNDYELIRISNIRLIWTIFLSAFGVW